MEIENEITVDEIIIILYQLNIKKPETIYNLVKKFHKTS